MSNTISTAIQIPEKALLERFLRYVQIDTQSEGDVEPYPSTEKQKDLSRLLVEELKGLGLTDAKMDQYGYVTATFRGGKKAPAVGFIAHVDTSPEVSGAGVKPTVHRNYQGGELRFAGDPSLCLTLENCSALETAIGQDIVTSDGTTLLGGDDKAGIAAIMTALEVLNQDPGAYGPIRIAFTPDEEVGRGTEFFDVAGFGAKYAYTVDGGTAGELSDETFNADSATITIGGINIHPGKAKGVMVNAIQVLGDLLPLLPPELTPQATDGREGFIHPISVTGGVDKAVLKLILRDFDIKGLDRQKALLEKIVEKIKAKHPQATIDLEIKHSYRNMRLQLEEEPKVVDYAVRAIEESGLVPNRLPIRGGTDGSELSRKGILTPNLFTGGANAHSNTEWVSVQQMAKAAEVVVRLASIWANA